MSVIRWLNSQRLKCDLRFFEEGTEPSVFGFRALNMDLIIIYFQNLAITRVLVLVPTRELGVQVYQVSRQLAQFTSIEIAMSVGGLDLKLQESLLR